MAKPQSITILAFGDSLTHGYGLPIADGFVPQLTNWLQQNGAPGVKIVNAGVSGDTTTGGLARLDWSLSDDIDAVILELGANDALRGVDPAITKRNLDQILGKLQARNISVLLAGMYAPRNWGPDYVTAFDGLYPALAAQYNVPLYPFFLEGVAGDPALNQPDGLHPNKQGVAVIVEKIGPQILALIQTIHQ